MIDPEQSIESISNKYIEDVCEKIADAPEIIHDFQFNPFYTELRCVALDTEATGARRGEIDKLTEIACVEIINGKITGKFFRRYINPEREVTRDVHKITGHTWNFLKAYPTFPHIMDDFLNFIDGSRLIIHDARQDLRLLNLSMMECGKPHNYIEDWHEIVDTLILAKYYHPYGKNNLTSLCQRYNVDTTSRNKHHGALIDAFLLANMFCTMKSKVRLPVIKL